MLTTEKLDAEIARMQDIYPKTLPKPKKHFEEDGAEVFGIPSRFKIQGTHRRVEQMTGKREVELALHKNILKGRSETD